MLISAAMLAAPALITFLTIRGNVLLDVEPKLTCPVTAPQPGK